VFSATARASAREPTLLLRSIPWVLMCALGACKEKPAATATENTPQYSLARPVEGLSMPRPRAADFRRGLSLELFVGEVEGDAQRAAYAGWLDQASRLGASDLELVVQWSQLDAAAVEMAPSATHTVDDAFLGWLMDQAAARSLRVLLTPVLELEQQAAARAIAPADHKRWFWAYHRFVLHYARIAEARGACCLAVGWDLPELEQDEAHWRELIADVRKAFKGKLAYAVRPDRLPALAFWDALELVNLVGVGALAQGPAAQADPRLAALSAGLRGWREQHDRPLLLTRTSAAPAAAGAEEQALRDQLDATRALYRALQGEPLVAGVYLNLAVPGAAGKPALLSRASGEVARHWYAGSRK
jgi:hypothetical protein